jgi:hypothetical protein
MSVVARWLVRLGAGTADGGVKQSCDGKGIVPDQLGGQAQLALAGEQPVLRIEFREFGRRAAGLLIGL